ncbi:MAG: BamA/TamA family outer membrane protein, partial [Rubrivivax sp.]|nr:BamA/TamA family outer membrane protein [Rubrivivax sp.]
MKRLLAAPALLALLLLAGCALLPGAGKDSPAAEVRVDSGREDAPGASVVRVEVVAPAALKTLLETYLDLVRLGRLGGLASGDTIDDSEWTRLIDATPAQVRELLQTEGYFAPEVEITRSPSALLGGPGNVRLQVTPGPRTRVSKVTIEVEGELERQASAGDERANHMLGEMRLRWPLPAGATFRNPDWSDAKVSALARLRTQGYASASWAGTGAEIDPDAHEARLFLVADSGPLYRYGGLRIEGLVAQDAQTVRNLAAARLGTPVTEDLLLDFQERLQKAALYESASVTLEADPAQAGAAEINVRLRELPLQLYTVGLGVSANTGPRASVEHVHRRAFGWAATARNKVEWGRLRQAWDGQLGSHPGEAMYRNLLGGAIERLETSSDVVRSQRLRVGRAQDTKRTERLYFVEAERASREAAGTRTDTLALSVNAHGLWRELDNNLLPTKGFTVGVQGGVGRSHGNNSDDGFFSRAYARVTGYLPLGSTWYGQVRVEAGQLFAASSVAVPDSQLFRAGGDDSV